MQHLKRPIAFFADKTMTQDISQGLNPIPIHAPHRMGQLIAVASSLDHQGHGNQRDRVVHGDSKPQIIVLANRETFVETAELIKQTRRHHHRGRAHQAKFQAAPKNVARRLCMFGPRIYLKSVTNPDFLGLADFNFRMLLHKRGLDFQFLRPPKVVRI
jgi:hypothetical protein